MEEEVSYAKRKKYDPQVYAQLLAKLSQLIEEVPKLRPDRDDWDIEGDWAATGTIYFVDKVHQSLFESIRHFDCRTIKLVNMDRPAVRITFYRKHRYRLEKDLAMNEKVEQAQIFINNLIVKVQILETKLDTLTLSKQAEAKGLIYLYQQQIKVWSDILAKPEQYEIAFSNYNRDHFYVTVNYKYKLPLGRASEYANEQEHLLNTQRDRLGNITQTRYNIIFVDPTEILREHPYQNREVEAYLSKFPIQSEAGRYTLYARLRAEVDIVNSFKL